MVLVRQLPAFAPLITLLPVRELVSKHENNGGKKRKSQTNMEILLPGLIPGLSVVISYL